MSDVKALADRLQAMPIRDLFVMASMLVGQREMVKAEMIADLALDKLRTEIITGEWGTR